MTPRTSRSGWSRTVPAGSRAVVEAGELGERRVAVEGAGRIGGGQVDPGVRRSAGRSPGGAGRGRVAAGRSGRGPRRRSARDAAAPAAGSRELPPVDEVRLRHHAAHRGVRARSARPTPPPPRRVPAVAIRAGRPGGRPGRHPGRSGRGAPPPAPAGPGGSPRTRRTPRRHRWSPASAGQDQVPLVDRPRHLLAPVGPVGGHPVVDLGPFVGPGQCVTSGIGRDRPQVHPHVEVRLRPDVVAALEKAQEGRLAWWGRPATGGTGDRLRSPGCGDRPRPPIPRPPGGGPGRCPGRRADGSTASSRMCGPSSHSATATTPTSGSPSTATGWSGTKSAPSSSADEGASTMARRQSRETCSSADRSRWSTEMLMMRGPAGTGVVPDVPGQASGVSPGGIGSEHVPLVNRSVRETPPDH